MRRHTLMVVFVVCLSALATAALVGCTSSDTPGGGSSSPGGGMMNGGGSGANGSSSAGERIYLTGVGTDGQDISRTAPRVSQGALMMDGEGRARGRGHRTRAPAAPP